MKKIQHTRIVQERGQITLPRAIRQIARWAAPLLPVSVSLEDPDQIVIEPYQKTGTDWGAVWREIKGARRLKGKGKDSLSSFIAADRYHH